jgi:hypothetical protein
MFDPVTHLEAYHIKPVKGQPKHVSQLGTVVADQFGTLTVDTIAPDRLLVPTQKGLGEPVELPAPSLVDHYKCYKVRKSRDTPKFAKVTVTVADQFENRAYTLTRPLRLCNAVDKDGEGMLNPDGHLMCYAVKRAKGELKHTRVIGRIHTHTQFGPEQLDSVKEAQLCVPATLTDSD